MGEMLNDKLACGWERGQSDLVLDVLLVLEGAVAALGTDPAVVVLVGLGVLLAPAHTPAHTTHERI
jgi:hypothetical protein